MTLIEWQDDFRTGITAVDFEHKSLIDLLNELYTNLGADAATAEIEGFLGEIHARIGAHFALEEKVMRACSYDQYGDHKADHDRLLDDIRDIMDRFSGGGYEGFSDDLSSHLKAWFIDHFKTKDSRLHRMVG